MAMVKLGYKPVGLLVGVADGIVASAAFTRV
jgi:hypothetical protein